MTGALIRLRIVVLQTEPDIWCDACGTTCATTTTYVVEQAGAVPSDLCLFTSCETCERHQLR